MSNYALINPDGLVVNTIVKDPETEITLQEGWYLVDITGLPVGIGCTYSDGQFTCPD
ncbi:hypothetical protein ABU550_000865 [Yersinia enterocolitica]